VGVRNELLLPSLLLGRSQGSTSSTSSSRRRGRAKMMYLKEKGSLRQGRGLGDRG
jgi:hypothetical protein